ncbi:hypothetical protein VNO78_03973 [Psophocarpus tetragonolobus]|uniref:Late nodulin domain-containing protein n=1 Tax=Psophocarpus tetragonolobus TaxID=3891 RepID=A0AAN9T406_PSOTE
MANGSVNQLTVFLFLFLVAYGLTQEAFAGRGDQCKVDKDCVKFCAHRPHCPVKCLDGYCLCNCASTNLHAQHNIFS